MHKSIDRERFICAKTTLAKPRLVPEIALHLSGDAFSLWEDTESLTAHQLPPPYWAFAWPGGQALARYVLDHPEEFFGRTVLDFGSGSGLVAVAAAKSGADCVCAAEIDALAHAAVALNAKANSVYIEPIESDIIGERARWRTVLAGDMCYERPLAERLLSWLRALAASGVRVFLGDPGRNYFPGDEGMTRLATYTVPTSLDLEDRNKRDASVYRLDPAA